MRPPYTNPRDILTLAALAILTGGFLALLVFAVALLADLETPLAWAGAAWALTSAYVWLILVNKWAQAHYPQPEPFEPPQAEHVRVDVLDSSDPGYLEGQYLDLPLDLARMVALAIALQQGARLGHNLAGPGRLMSRAEYEGVRDYFITSGLARWVNPRAPTRGLELSARGRAVVKGFAAQSPADPLQIKKKSK